MNPHVDMEPGAWLALHNQVLAPGEAPVISASMAAAIMGKNPWKSPYTLYHQLRGDVPHDAETPEMRAGKAAEPEVARRYQEVTGREVRDLGDYAVHFHPEYPFICATLDRMDAEERAVELKSPSLFNMSEWEDGAPPLQYQIQNQIQIACAGLDRGALAAVPQGRESDFYHYDFDRHDGAIKTVIEAIILFRERVVNADEPPMDTSDSSFETFKELHPLDDGSTVVRPDLEQTVENWIAAKNDAKDAEKMVDEFKREIIAAMGVSTFLIAGGYKVSYKHQHRGSYVVNESDFRVLREAK